MKRYLLALLFLTLSSHSLFAQSDPRDYVVSATATVQNDPASITLKWPADTRATRITVFRRMLGTHGGWGKSTIVAVTDSVYVDTQITKGQAYEYYIQKACKSGTSTWNAIGYIASGLKVSPTPNRILILVADDSMAALLVPELSRLETDLRREGWRIIRHNVSRYASVESVRALINTDYISDPDNVTTLLLFGHVPVPYSGDIAPDGHVPGSGNHQGAWACDMYYGNLDGDWTDDTVDDTTAYRLENRNVPGDGKFDQDSITSEMALEVGRVDLSNLPSFSKSEVELLRQYLDKDHAFRTGALKVGHKALVDVNFPVFEWYDVPGEDAWRNFPMLVGPDSTVDFHKVSADGSWINHLDSNNYLWAYGCGAGWYTSCNGVGTTADFAAKDANAVFYMVFGSFFGDWDSQDNFTRAPLASGYGLTSCWVSRPFWFVHPMGLGQSIGYCTKLTMNNGGFNSLEYRLGFATGSVHLGLMGDPTLRQEYPAIGLSSLTAAAHGSLVDLSWPVIAGVKAYNVYRASSPSAPFMRITSSPVSLSSFTDVAPLSDTNYYLVRPAELVTTPSGTYYAEGPGAMQQVYVPASGVDIVRAGSEVLCVSQTKDLVTIGVRLQAESRVDLSIVDPLGREINVLERGRLLSGSKSYSLDPKQLASGLYFAKLQCAGGEYSAKIMITK